MIHAEYRAEDARTGFTLGELYQVLQHINEGGGDPLHPVKAVVGFRGQLQKIRVEEPK